MSLQPAEMTNQANLTYLTDSDQVDEDDVVSLAHFTMLTKIQKSVLKKTIDGMKSDLRYTDDEIASMLDISRHSVVNARHNANYNHCLREWTLGSARNDAPDVLEAMKKSALKGSVRAQETYLRVTEYYIPTQRNQNLNADLTKSVNLSSKDAMLDVVASLCDLGWHIGRIHDSIDEAYAKLQSEGRIPQTQTAKESET